MVKKKATRKKTHKNVTPKKATPSKNSNKLEDKIVQNLADLQKVHINLAEKFESLSEQISNLLALFETSARTFANQPHHQFTQRDKEFLEKIDKLLDQNKTIAKGLTLMEGKMRERLYGPVVPSPERNPGSREPPRI